MTARHDPDRLIKTFLEDGPMQLSDRAYDAVRSEIDKTSQRVVIGPWRIPTLNNFARYGIAAAAIVVVAVLVFQLSPKTGQVGGPGVTATPVPTATPAPTASPASTAAPSSAAVRLPFQTGELAPGTYFIEEFTTTRGAHMQFTVPAGWIAEYPALKKGADIVGEVAFDPWVVTHIFRNGCQWDEEDVVEVGTVDEIVDALADQAGREASAPRDVTIGGLAAKRIELTTSPDLDTTTCTNGNQRYWPGAGPDFSSGLCCHPAGNTDVVYVVDNGRNPLVLVARHYPGSSANDIAELQSIVDSLQIEP